MFNITKNIDLILIILFETFIVNIINIIINVDVDFNINIDNT